MEDDVLEPGTILGNRYVVDRLIGYGGWGSVYEAEHRYLKRRVAIKVLHSADTNNPKNVERFVREAQAMARLRHPNIVEVIELEIDGPNAPFIVMERLIGETLSSRLVRKGRLDRPTALDLGKQILSALETAHGEGIVHRDLKPGNIFLVDDGRKVKVLDFGIAKVQSAASQLTTTGGLLGTPLYMAPEQFLLNPIDARTDLHAVGLCLNEMLTGSRLFGAEKGPELIARVLSEESRETRTGDPRLDEIIKKACSRNPDDRYPTAQAMIDALTAIERTDEGKQNAATATLTDLNKGSSSSTSTTTSTSSSWRVFVLAALVVVALGAPPALFLLRRSLFSQPTPIPTTTTTSSPPPPRAAADAEPEPEAAPDADVESSIPTTIHKTATPHPPPPSHSSKPKPSPDERDNCRCIGKRKGHDADLCPQLLPPTSCFCRAPQSSLPLCQVPYDDRGWQCAKYVSGTEGDPCSGIASSKLPDGGLMMLSGVIKCAHCYNPIPRVRAVPGAECSGFDYDGVEHLDGRWACR